MEKPGCAKQPNAWEPSTGQQALMQIFNNSVYNKNLSTADVLGCGAGVTIAQMHATCGPNISALVTSERPSDSQIISWARAKLGI